MLFLGIYEGGKKGIFCVRSFLWYVDHLELGQAYQLDMEYKEAGALLSGLNSRWEKVSTSI